MASVTVGSFSYNFANGDSDPGTSGYQLFGSNFNSFSSTADFALVAVGWESTPTAVPLASVSYGGVPMSLLYSKSTPFGSTTSQSLYLYYLANPGPGNSLVVANWAPSAHPGWVGAPSTSGPGQFIYATTFDNVTTLPAVYDFDDLSGTTITLTGSANSDPILHYDLVLNGASFANSGGGVFPASSQSGGQTLILKESDNGTTSMNLIVASHLTSDSFSHTYTYGVPPTVIQAVGIAFIPEPSGAFLLGITGVLGILRRRRFN